MEPTTRVEVDRPRGLIRIAYAPGARLTLADIDAALAALALVPRGERARLLVDATNLEDADSEYRRVMARHLRARPDTVMAVFGMSPLVSVMGALFARATRLHIRFFRTGDEALEWLLTEEAVA